MSVPKSLFALGAAFLYGLVAYFWPDVPFDQDTFALVVVAVLGWLGVEVRQGVNALRSDLVNRGALPPTNTKK